MEIFVSRQLYLAKPGMLVGALVRDDQHYSHITISTAEKRCHLSRMITP